MIPLMKNTFIAENETKKALADFILRTDKLSMGDKCIEFENEFSILQKRKHSILFNSGGSANLALLQALKNLGKIKDGDKVGFSALTWSTNVMPIIQMGLVPVAIDCNRTTLNVHLSNIERSVQKHPDIKVLFLTNVLGFLGDLDKINAYCKSHGIILLEDNCESLGSELPSGLAGNFSLGSTFSFFVAHHMSTIEGGMICTDDDDLAEMLRITRANGWDRNLTAEQQVKWRSKFKIESEFQAKYTFYDLGFNLRPTEITGFLGLTQLKYLKDNIARRQENFNLIESEIKKNDDLVILDHSHMKTVSSFAIIVLAKNKTLKDKYFNQFAGAGVEIRPVIAGNMQKQPFYSKYVRDTEVLSEVDFIHECGFYCGNYPELTKMDLETYKSCLKKR